LPFPGDERKKYEEDDEEKRMMSMMIEFKQQLADGTGICVCV